MIGTIVEFYNHTKIDIINKVSGTVSLATESGYLDDVEIEIRIEKIKEKLSDIRKKMDFSKSDKHTLVQLNADYEDKILELVFLASNKIEHIDELEQMLPKKYNFYSCIKGLQQYKNRNYEAAYYSLSGYLGEKGFFESHFLLNKVFGRLLIMNEEYERAGVVLRKAVEYRPTDLECHKLLVDIYNNIGNSKALKAEKAIIKMIE